MPTVMRSLLELVAVILSGGLFYYVGRNQAKILDKLKQLQENQQSATIISNDERFMTANMPDNNKEVGITTPKSPQLLEFEAEQALRTFNDNYRVKPQ